MDKYKLHSHGDNWFHFRKDLDSAMESFSVTYCHDGTVCLTGDYGCLCWQRAYFPDKPDYGFPNKQSGIGYFAEKVVRAEEDQKIKTWKKDLAIREINESIEQRKSEDALKEIQTLQDILDQLDYFESGEYGYIQMLEAFGKTNTHIEPETFCDYGRCFTDVFVQRYEKLISVSDQILEVVAKNQQEG